MNTPWGISQNVETIGRGIHWVSTAGHGGLMVSAGVAEKILSAQAIKTAHPGKCGGYVCFEEDCSYAVAFFEHPEWKRHLDQKSVAEWQHSELDPDSYMGKAKAEAMPKLTAEVSKSDDAIREDMRAVVTSWNPEYFAGAEMQPIELGI
jgi:uncharacterized protein DUF7007